MSHQQSMEQTHGHSVKHSDHIEGQLQLGMCEIVVVVVVVAVVEDAVVVEDAAVAVSVVVVVAVDVVVVVAAGGAKTEEEEEAINLLQETFSTFHLMEEVNKAFVEETATRI